MVAMRRPGGWVMHDYDGAMMDGAGAWVTMLLSFLLFLALIGIAIYWVARATSPGESLPAPRPPSPRDVLDLRLARGEITPDEYGSTTQLLDRSA